MKSQTITVIARLRAKKGKEEQLRQALLALITPSRLEKGCLNYDFHESLDQPGLFFFHENWANHNALTRHFEMSHFKEAQQKTKDLLAEPPEILSLVKIEP
jgi:quinol monooxygenase YgiN